MPSIRLLMKLALVAVTARSTRDFYDRVSPFYESLFTGHLPHVRTMADTLTEKFSAQNRIDVLDLACGTGALTRRLEARAFCVTGLDFSFQSLSRLRKTSNTIRLVQADAKQLPFAATSFDAVTCIGAWRHFAEPQRVLDEIRRVLRPNGIFLVGYFPPKLGGLFSTPRGISGGIVVWLYGRVIRLLDYDDRADQEMERQTLQMINLRFAKYRLLQSGEREHLILAESALLGLHNR